MAGSARIVPWLCARDGVLTTAVWAAQGDDEPLEGLLGQVQELRQRLHRCTQQAACCAPVPSRPREEAHQQAAAVSGKAGAEQVTANGTADQKFVGDWQLSESRADVAGQSFSLVFINPRALISALGRYFDSSCCPCPIPAYAAQCTLPAAAAAIHAVHPATKE